jgi:hypothetical protein
VDDELDRALREERSGAARQATYASDVAVTVVAHSVTHLERLAEELIAEGERLNAPWNMVAVDPVANCVQVGFDDMDAPAARAMIGRFASEPVSWSVEPPATAV